MKRPAAIGSLNKTLEDMRGGIKKAKTDDENKKNAESENESEEEDHRDKGRPSSSAKCRKIFLRTFWTCTKEKLCPRAHPALERTSSTSCSQSCPLVRTAST
jgi:hypothetical protein